MPVGLTSSPGVIGRCETRHLGVWRSEPRRLSAKGAARKQPPGRGECFPRALENGRFAHAHFCNTGLAVRHKWPSQALLWAGRTCSCLRLRCWGNSAITIGHRPPPLPASWKMGPFYHGLVTWQCLMARSCSSLGSASRPGHGRHRNSRLATANPPPPTSSP